MKDALKIVAGGELEPRVREIGRGLLEEARSQRTWWTRYSQQEVMLEKMMGRDDLRAAAMRFVDVLPVLRESGELTDHLHEYFHGVDFPLTPRALKNFGLRAARWPVLSPLTARSVRMLSGRMAKRFIAGDRLETIRKALHGLHGRGMGFTLDLLGEAVVSDREAEGYQKQYLGLLAGLEPVVKGWEPSAVMDSISGRVAPRQNLSVKVSALYSQISAVDAAGSAEAIKRRLRPIMHEARKRRAFITLDMEHYDFKGVTLRVFKEILMERELRDWPDAGLAMQAYLRDTPGDLAELIEWAKRRGTPVMVRLVRGAYWDFETVHARQHGWEIPVWTKKPETDVCYERCLAMLLGSHPHVEAAVATHNVRSLAVAMAMAERLGMTPGMYETQMLYGMADEVKRALVDRGVRMRVYVPFGELIPGMAYLVRRLLENTGSQSFLSMGFNEKVDVEVAMRRPEIEEDPATGRGLNDREHNLESGRKMDLSPFSNEPERRFTDAKERAAFAAALEGVRGRLGGDYPLLIGGAEQKTAGQLKSINPARPSQVVGVAASASREDAAAAIGAAAAALPAWRDTDVRRRAEILFKAAAIMRQRRDELAAWEVFEAGKPWREADADITEAIDFLEYYGREAVRLWGGHNLDVVGETNRYFYEPRGVGVVISPWNFPLAILCGMASAAIATGNTVVVKPAPQTPVIAAHYARIMHEAGLPPGVLNYLPGGDEAGDALVRDPRVKFIAFTGSVAVGTHIMKVAAELGEGQQHLKHVIAELGGKNAIIVDSDADPDESVLGVAASAFGFAGQKCSACSRAIVVGSGYDAFVQRLVEAAASMKVGDPTDPGVVVGPVVDEEAYKRLKKAAADAKAYCKPALEPDVSKLGDGYFIGPTIFADVPPDSPLGQQELFGPVLGVMKARDFDHALEIANSTRYALTGGVYSRSPAHLEEARQKFRVGNLYLNRKITGAIVGRHPFGGMKLSGTDAKAGGPDYLLHFVEARHVTENTIRRGFAPEAMS